MDAVDHGVTEHGIGEAVAPQPESERIALWRALAAERRARDERTARLRTMRLIADEDETA